MAMKRKLDVPDDRLSSLDEHGHHIEIEPASVSGRYRRARDWAYFVLIVVFLVLPWTRFGGEQTILLDIPARRFVFFGLSFWAHDIPLVFFVFGIMCIALSLVTAAFGRIWCGWACPQTVFIDRVYRKIEEWVEGNHHERAKLNRAPMSWKKVRTWALKWFLFFFISTNIAHSFTAYFIGAERLLGMSLAAPWENWTPFLFVTILTAALLFDFGWFREQFCVIMCPYGRFQSVLMDDNSLGVLYDEKRGEPRKGTEEEGHEHGDCVNCYRCVSVCPTGIDIRRGTQMECIACTACIDACDEIMLKVGRPEGLIRYASENSIGGGKTRDLRPRTVVYASLLVAFIVGLGVSVARRQMIDIQFIRAIETPYTQKVFDDGHVEITNHYRIHLKNQYTDTLTVSLAIAAPNPGVTLIAPTFPMRIAGNETQKTHAFFTFANALTATTGRQTISVEASFPLDGETLIEVVPISLVGPFGNSADENEAASDGKTESGDETKAEDDE